MANQPSSQFTHQNLSVIKSSQIVWRDVIIPKTLKDSDHCDKLSDELFGFPGLKTIIAMLW